MARTVPEAVLLIGIPGAGKTTFYVQNFFQTHVRISRDMLRTRARESELVRACFATHQSFVVDDTNLTRAERQPMIAEALAAGFRVCAYFFTPNVRRSIALNKKRVAKQNVPVFGVLLAFKRLEPPSMEEGFAALYDVDFGPDGQFIVSPGFN